MRRSRSTALLVVVLAAVASAAADPGKDTSQPGFLGFGKGTHSKEPVTITADSLEYEYKDGIIVYHGSVEAVQGDVTVHSNELRITLAKADDNGKGAPNKTAGELDDVSTGHVQEVVASGSVRIDQGTRWAVGGKATFDQSNRTIVLTENPVLHDGKNEVAGDRVVVFLDEDRSVVEGGRKRVKAVLFPNNDTAPKKEADAKKEPAKDAGKEPAKESGKEQAR